MESTLNMDSFSQEFVSNLRSELTSLEFSAKASDMPRTSGNRFQDLYYQSRVAETQGERRQRQLMELRNKRRDESLLRRYADVFAEHGTSDNMFHSDEADADAPETLEKMEEECDDSVHFGSRKKQNSVRLPRLMLSEWLLEIPCDFEDSWKIIACPTGKRCSVVTFKGKTLIYARTGSLLNTGTSFLPGGNMKKPSRDFLTVLDCIFDKDQRKLYVLDALFWNGQPLMDLTVEFRFFWITSRLMEIESNSVVCDETVFELARLQDFSCATDCLERFFQTKPDFPSELDGFLFFHKEGLYIQDTTPLVCWLKPYMVPDVLKIPVPVELTLERPDEYTSLPAYIELLESQREKRRGNRQKRHSRSQKSDQDSVGI